MALAGSSSAYGTICSAVWRRSPCSSMGTHRSPLLQEVLKIYSKVLVFSATGEKGASLKIENILYEDLSYKLWCYTRISSHEKSRNKTCGKIRYFFTCVLYRQSATGEKGVTRFSRHSIRLLNEWKSLHDSQYKVVCRNVLELWRLKHLKIRIAHRR